MKVLGYYIGGLSLSALLLTATAASLRPGEFLWEPELSPSGPVVIVISLPDQALSAYRNGIRIAYSTISSGAKGRSTPPGVFTILEKEVTHFSNKYHHAPMPFMQRLTWQGVALHGSDLPGYPASHGCIRLPKEFAKLLFSITTRGTTVIVMGEKAPEPTLAAQPGMILVGRRKPARCGRSKAPLNGRRNEARKVRSQSWRARRTKRFTF